MRSSPRSRVCFPKSGRGGRSAAHSLLFPPLRRRVPPQLAQAPRGPSPQGAGGVMRRSAMSNAIPRTCRRITRTTPSLITSVRTSARAHPAGSRVRMGRSFPTPAGVFRSMTDRFNDDRDLTGLKLALLAVVLLLVAFQR